MEQSGHPILKAVFVRTSFNLLAWIPGIVEHGVILEAASLELQIFTPFCVDIWLICALDYSQFANNCNRIVATTSE